MLKKSQKAQKYKQILTDNFFKRTIIYAVHLWCSLLLIFKKCSHPFIICKLTFILTMHVKYVFNDG